MTKTKKTLFGVGLLAVALALSHGAAAQGGRGGGFGPGGPGGGPGGPGRGGPGRGGFGGFGGPAQPAEPDPNNPFNITPVYDFNEPWAMEFLPDGERVLVTERRGELKLLSLDTGSVGDITGVPQVAYAGQGGLGDIVLHPNYAQNGMVYLSYAENDESGDLSGAVVALAKLTLDSSGGGKLEDLRAIWRQEPKQGTTGHYSHRIAFGPDGYLYISSGDRMGPVSEANLAQSFDANLGKIVRLTLDGAPAPDNPFADRGGVAAQIWTMGHRNLLGLVFDRDGQLWNIEMGPQGGDEINRIVKGSNYGWPLVSEGVNYGGAPIPDHVTRPEFKAPVIAWVPSISPGAMMFYYGGEFADWDGDVLVAGLSSQALLRVEIDGEKGTEAARYGMGQRIRSVEQGRDGTLYVIEDGARGGTGRMLKLTPK